MPVVTTEEHGMATNTDEPEDVELASYQQLVRIAGALAEEMASIAASLHGINHDGIVVHEAVQS